MGWNKRDYFYHVYDPEIAHKFLQSTINDKENIIKFNYKIGQDKKWKSTKFLSKLIKIAK